MAVGVLEPDTLATREFIVASGEPFVDEIALGGDGNMWFSARLRNSIGRVTANGTVTEFAIRSTGPTNELNPTGSSGPVGLVWAPDASLWFTEIFGNRIGRLSPE